MTQHNIARALLALAGLVFTIIGAGLAFGQDWGTFIWPWPDGKLTYLVAASIVGPVGICSLYAAWTQNFRAAIAGGIALVVCAAGAAFVIAETIGRGAHATGTALVALGGLALIAWCAANTPKDSLAAPKGARLALSAVALVLITVSTFLLTKFPTVFPWPLKPETSLLYGALFFGLFIAFAYAMWTGAWGDAELLLIGLLVYDLILIGPFLQHFGKVLPEHALSLKIYVAVLVITAPVAAYYLFWGRPKSLSP
jgi:hypothetical protein